MLLGMSRGHSRAFLLVAGGGCGKTGTGHKRHARGSQVPRQARPIRAGPFHPRPGRLCRTQPSIPTASRCPLPLPGTTRPRAGPRCRRAPRRPSRRGGCQRHQSRGAKYLRLSRHPFLFTLVRDGAAATVRHGGSSCYGRAIRRTPTTTPSARAGPTSCSPRTGWPQLSVGQPPGVDQVIDDPEVADVLSQERHSFHLGRRRDGEVDLAPSRVATTAGDRGG